jgi:DinB superfamily
MIGPGSDIVSLIAEIDANVSHAESVARGLSHEQFNWRSEPGRWSIGQALAHLNIVDGQDLAPLRAGIDAGRSRNLTGTGPFTYGLVSRKVVASMEPPVTRKSKAPANYQPPPEADPEVTLAEYRRISAAIRELAKSASGLHLRRVKTSLPALPALLRTIVKMPLGARFALITAHDRRHLWQADQIRNHPGFPS